MCQLLLCDRALLSPWSWGWAHAQTHQPAGSAPGQGPSHEEGALGEEDPPPPRGMETMAVSPHSEAPQACSLQSLTVTPPHPSTPGVWPRQPLRSLL